MYNPAPNNDFQRSLSFAAIRSSFDKMLVEMDQNKYLFMHFVCANIFGAIVLKPRFKIDTV